MSTSDDEAFFFQETQDEKAEALKLLSVWQSAMGSLSTKQAASDSSSSLRDVIETDFHTDNQPLLAIDLDNFGIDDNDIQLIQFLWTLLHHGQQHQQQQQDITLIKEEEHQRRSRLPGRNVPQNLLSPSSSSSTPMAVLITGDSSSSSSKLTRNAVELSVIGEEEEEDILKNWSEVSEGFFGDQVAFHTSTHSLTVDTQAWARVKGEGGSSTIRLVIFPYPAISTVSSIWTTLTQPYEVDDKDVHSHHQKRAVALDVLRGLIESSHRSIAMKILIWNEVQRIAQSAALASDASTSSSASLASIVNDSDVTREWQMMSTEVVATHPLVKLLVILLDRTPFDSVNGDDGGDIKDEEYQQPREIAAAKILHASALSIASRRGVVVSDKSLIAKWCYIAAPVAADCLDLFCSAFNGLSIDNDTVSHDTSSSAPHREDEYTTLKIKHTSSSSLSPLSSSLSRTVEVSPPPLPRWDEQEEEEEEEEKVITAMMNGNFAVSFPKFKTDTKPLSEGTDLLLSRGLNGVSDELLDRALGITVNDQQAADPPLPPSVSLLFSNAYLPERMSFHRGTSSSGRGKPQSTLRGSSK